MNQVQEVSWPSKATMVDTITSYDSGRTKIKVRIRGWVGKKPTYARGAPFDKIYEFMSEESGTALMYCYKMMEHTIFRLILIERLDE
jgi:hypothetical protein